MQTHQLVLHVSRDSNPCVDEVKGHSRQRLRRAAQSEGSRSRRSSDGERYQMRST